ncbi:hypothetical protein ACKBNH_004153 [Vibrio vulnificus]
MVSKKIMGRDLSFISILFLSAIFFVSMSPELFGGVISKSSILVIILFNITLFRIGRVRLMAISLISVFLILKYFLVEFLSTSSPDYSPIVLCSYLLLLITTPFHSSNYFISIRYGLLLAITAGFIASSFSLFMGNDAFLHSLYNKGLIDVSAFIGFTSIPQTFASLALLYIFSLTGQKGSLGWLISSFSILCSINRIMLFGYFSLFLINKRLLLVLSLLLVLFVFYGLSIDDGFLTTQTLASRNEMLINVINYISSLSSFDLLFGTFIKPDFYIHESGISYIENGFAFIVYYFGFVGLLIYLSFVFVVGRGLINSLVNKKLINIRVVTFFFYISLFVPFFTHEFLFVSFYLSIAFVIRFYIISNAKKNPSGDIL